MSQPTKPHPGAPRGNTNALKHGYYARRIPAAELTRLSKIEPLDLTGEQQVIRYLIAIITERARDVTDPALAVSMLRAISLAAITLARIQRTQQIIAASAPDDDFAETLNTVVSELMAEARLGPQADPEEVQALAAQIRAEPPPGQYRAPLTHPAVAPCKSTHPIPPIDQPIQPIDPTSLPPRIASCQSISPSRDPLNPAP